MQTKIPYGGTSMNIDIPDRYALGVAVSTAPKLEVDEISELKRAMREPVGTQRLGDLACGRHKAAIIISDSTRPTPSAKILPLILEELGSSGIRDEDVVIITASGTHRPNTPDELRKLVGDEIWGRVAVLAHDCEDKDNLVYIGTTQNGTPVEINKKVAEADLKISVSCIEPHHNAGWSGGAKNILPGVSSRDTVFRHHTQANYPGVGLGINEGNPFREDLEDAGRLAGVDFILNCYLDTGGKVVKAFAGDLIKAHRAGAKFITDLMSFSIPRRANIIIASPGGAPRDRNFWQSEGKCLTRVNTVIEDGGIVILVAECAEGIGHDKFAEALSQPPQEIIDRFSQESFSVMGNKAFRLAKLISRLKLFFVSDKFSPELLSKLPIRFFASAQEALDEAIKEIKAEPAVLAIPHATRVLIKVE